MFYHKQENNYIWFKSDKDKFWVWQKKIFMFTYSAKSGLNLEKTIDLFS